jgi:hypothetical protein
VNDKRWLKEAATLSPFHRHGAAIINQVNGPDAALEYVRAARKLTAHNPAKTPCAPGEGVVG